MERICALAEPKRKKPWKAGVGWLVDWLAWVGCWVCLVCLVGWLGCVVMCVFFNKNHVVSGENVGGFFFEVRELLNVPNPHHGKQKVACDRWVLAM